MEISSRTLRHRPPELRPERKVTEVSKTHLWEIDHPYYCNEGNYFSVGCGEHYNRWQDFIDEQGDNDLDMNLVFRFDWVPPYDDEDPEKLWEPFSTTPPA